MHLSLAADAVTPPGALELTDVRSRKTHYTPGERAGFVCTLRNRGTTPAAGSVAAVLVQDMETLQRLPPRQVTVPAGQTLTLEFKAKLGRTEYGQEFRAWLVGTESAAKCAVFGVSANVGTVGILGESAYANYTDEFAWAPDDFGNMSPATETWYSGQCGGLRTKTVLARKLAERHARGVKCLTYGKGVAGGPDGIRLLLAHPDWALFNRFGQLGGLDMSFDVWSLKHWAQEPHRNAVGKEWRFWNCWTPNFTRPEAVRFGTEALARSARMFGWDGVRFDAQFDVFGGFAIDGRPLPAGAGRDAINARNVTAVKRQLRREFPHFVFGYNYGVPGAAPSALDRAVCAGLGLVMDEGIRNASDPQHPLQDWGLYARQILDESAAVRRLGGVPLIFGSGLASPAADYAMAFCLAGGGTPYGWHFGQCSFPYDAFATRWSGLLWSPELAFVTRPDDLLDVQAGGSTLWWRDWVRAGHAPDGTPRLVLHLFNPPPRPFIRETTALAPPLGPVHVTLRIPQGKAPLRAWLLTCSPTIAQRRLMPEPAADGVRFTLDPLDLWAVLVIDGAALAKPLAAAGTQPLPVTAGIGPAEKPVATPPLPPLTLKPSPAVETAKSNTPCVALPLGNGRFLLENRWVHLEIDPRHGGRIASFVDRRDGLERIVPGRLDGMFLDNVYDQDGMLYQGQWSIDQAAIYTGEIVMGQGAGAAVKVGREMIADEGGVPNPNYSGLWLEREFQLRVDSPVVTCVVRIRNRSSEGRCPAYSLRQGYADGVHREQLRCFRPSRRGIRPAGPALADMDQMVWDPAAGWTATLDLESGRGAAWLMDAGRVMMFYNSTSAITPRQIEDFPNRDGVDPLYMFDNASVTAVGADWYYRRAFIPAGATWETTVRLVPLQGLVRAANGGDVVVAHACEYFVAAVDSRRDGNSAEFAVRLHPSLRPLSDVEVRVATTSVRLRKGAPGGGLLRGGLPGEVGVYGFPPMADLPADAVLYFHVSGRDADGREVVVTFPFVTRPLGPEAAPLLPAPAKVLDYQPHTATRQNVAVAAPSVLFLQGLGYEAWGLDGVLARRGATVRASEFMKRRVATAVRYFPATLEEALQFDLIILSAVDAFALSDEGVLILHDYVESGGALLVLGGLYSFGGGRFREFGLDAFLPLRCPQVFDLVPWRGHAKWDPAAARVLGVQAPLPPLPDGAWRHDLEAAPGALVLARADGKPLLAVSRLGQGRMAAVAATTLGEAASAGRWGTALAPVVQWLLPAR